MSARYVLVKVDAQNGRNPLAKQLGVPRNRACLLLWDVDGKELSRISQPKGFHDVETRFDAAYRGTVWRRADVREYVRTMRPLTADLEARVTALARQLGHRRFEVRKRAAAELTAMGAAAVQVLAKIQTSDPEARQRASLIVSRFRPLDRIARRLGLDHDVDYLVLSTKQAPEFSERLKRILPAEAPETNLRAWWAKHGTNYRWNAVADRYEVVTAQDD